MREAILPLPQYAFMAWCSAKAQGQRYRLPLYGVSLMIVEIVDLMLISSVHDQC
jgi:hypothetical protein